MTRNGCEESSKILMHVDTSVPLWAVFDLVGSTTAIQIVGTLSNPQASSDSHSLRSFPAQVFRIFKNRGSYPAWQ